MRGSEEDILGLFKVCRCTHRRVYGDLWHFVGVFMILQGFLEGFRSSWKEIPFFTRLIPSMKGCLAVGVTIRVMGFRVSVFMVQFFFRSGALDEEASEAGPLTTSRSRLAHGPELRRVSVLGHLGFHAAPSTPTGFRGLGCLDGNQFSNSRPSRGTDGA